MIALFDDYAKKLKDLNADVPAIFENVAKRGALRFRKEAVKLTDKEKLVDTGNYRRNWNAQSGLIAPETYAIEASNNVEYASHLEYGHKLRNGGRWKGRFVGRRSLDETRYYCIQQLDDEFEKAYRNQ